jgi:general secretion pathway protein D
VTRGIVSRAIVWLPLVLMLVSCAEQRLRERIDTQLRSGQYEGALKTVDSGVKEIPESTILHAGRLQVMTQAFTRLVAEASEARSEGRLDDAMALLERARAFDPGMKRVNAMLQDIDVEKRQLKAVNDSEALAAKGRNDAALRLATDALKENPRHVALAGLVRRLELEQRDAATRSARTGLAETRTVSLDFRDASLRSVLDVVSRSSGINFVLDKDIRSDIRVTVFLRSARVEDAIDLVVSTNQLVKKVLDSQTILIYPNTPDKQREYQEHVVRVFHLANAEAKAAAAFLRAMLKLRDPFVDDKSNMLALRDTPENIQMAERLIAVFDAAEPEVLLDLEVLEVSSNRLTELGVHFPDTFSLSVLPPAGAAQLTLGNVRGVGADRVGLSMGNLLINLKRSVGDVNTLSAPRIRVKNKEKAKVLVGDKIPVITATTGTGGFVSDSVSYIEVGLKLDVEPVVFVDDDVSIKVSLEVSSLGSQVKTGTGTLAYQIGTRNASTVLRLRDGQTQLLAGLMSRDERSSASRLPGLGDVPLLGRLFSDQSDATSRTELVLAITPHVLRNMRQPDITQSEMWVGTEASPRLRAVGGRVPNQADAKEAASRPSPDGAKPAAAAPVAASGPMTVAIKAPPSGKVGEAFAVTVDLGVGAQAFRGVSFEIGYPDDRVSIVSVEEGSLLAQGGPSSFTHSVIPGGASNEGRVKGAVLRSDNGDVHGHGSLVKVWVKPLVAGPTELRIVRLEPIGGPPQAGPAALPPPARIDIRQGN